MKLRPLALALALAFGFTGMVEAKQKPVVRQKPAVHRAVNKKTKQSRARAVKPRKAKRAKHVSFKKR